MTHVGAAIRRAPPRLEVRLPLTHSSDISFGIVLRKPRRRRRKHSPLQSWGRAFATAGCVAIAAVMPIWTVVAAPDLERVGSFLLSTPAPVAVATAEPVAAQRAVVVSRHAPVTAVRADPPGLNVYTVQPGDTLLFIAARYEVTPQTVAFNNGLKDSGDVRAGQTLIVPPLDAAIYAVREGDTIDSIAARFGVEANAVRTLNSVVFEPEDVSVGRVLLVPMPEGRYPGFRLVVSEAPRVFAPRVRWPTEGIVTQLFSSVHTGIDIAAPYGSPVVASGSGTVSWVGWRGSGGLAVCVLLDWGLETCDYHLSATQVELGERVVTGERIASVGSSGVSTGPHVHWEARTNGVLVDPMTYAPTVVSTLKVGGATGSP